MAGSTKGKRRPKPKATAVKEPEDVGPDYITLRIPTSLLAVAPTVTDQHLRLTPRQARAQRLVYDGLAILGENVRGSTKVVGTTAPIWHGTAWLLDQIADAVGMDTETTRDTLL